MTKEQESIVIEELNQLIEKARDLREEEFYTIFTIHEVQNIETVLNILKQKDEQIAKYEKIYKEYDCYRWVKELNKKDKIIDLMSKWLYEDDTSFGYDKLKDVNTSEKIKQYFERKVKDGN